MKPMQIHLGLFAIFLALSSVTVAVWVHGSKSRLERSMAGDKGPSEVAIAAAADEGYCSATLKKILRRVLTSCGLVKEGKQSRGCQPMEAKKVAAMSGSDFNSLFAPLSKRAAIIQFDLDKAELDEPASRLLEKTFSDQRGASYFLVVSRSSPEGSVAYNRKLSKARANAVLEHLKEKFKDPDLEREVGFLWLGEEFAQLDKDFCTWNRSRADTPCSGAALNRSAFIAWIDCRL